jgi:hypothetical protein
VHLIVLLAAAAAASGTILGQWPKREMKIGTGGRGFARRLEAKPISTGEHQWMEEVTGLAEAGEALMMPLIAATTPPAIASAKTTENRTFLMARSPDRSRCGR